MTQGARLRAEVERLQAGFIAAGAVRMEADILQPADTLLDLYGEDIRARAYVTRDPMRGEMMLRPDFTVPVVQRHMKDGAEPARYTYQGAVFRTSEPGSSRSDETLQVGYELFDRGDPAAADAEVFALIAGLLQPYGLRAAMGDMGLLRSAVAGLQTSDARRGALMRHLWRPARFKQLLDRFSGRIDASPARVDMLVQMQVKGIAGLQDEAGPPIGLRSRAEVAERLEDLAVDAKTPPIAAEEVQLLDTLLDLKDRASDAVDTLRDLAASFQRLQPAVDRLDARLAAMETRGIASGALEFQAAYGRTTLEYYDGFVFGFYAPGRDDLPVIASGGRYDALTRVLGQGREIPAVGGVIRPEFIAALQGGKP